MKKRTMLSILVMSIFILTSTHGSTVQGSSKATTTNKYQASTDLNGDGKTDRITLTFTSEYEYTLMINGISIKGEGENVNEKIYIVDINKGDKIKEVAIEEDGPSDDYATTFFYYNGIKIVKSGVVGGKCASTKRIKPNGIVLATSRFSVLQTWFYDDEFKLNAKHMLSHVAKKWYRINYKQEVKLLKPLKLYKAMNSKKLLTTLKIGDSVQMMGSDNKSWCAVKTKQGALGWFEVVQFDKVKQFNLSSTEVFDGLCMAD
jgi:hypothetical protein